MTEVEEVAALLRNIVGAIVDRPECLVLVIGEIGTDVTFRVTVHKEDLGKVIGKQGRTARSVRTILSAISMTKKSKYSLDISEQLSESS